MEKYLDKYKRKIDSKNNKHDNIFINNHIKLRIFSLNKLLIKYLELKISFI